MTYIFLGPSLPIKEAQTVLEAHYLPPAVQGDIISLVKEKRPKIIGLIDGYFSQFLPVWHKEILYALEEGVSVFGSSSMGALRAAETDRFGMVGIGRIYEIYRSGELTDDDEVALIHGQKENEYLNLSLPMVNIRITLQEAEKKGLISCETCQKWTHAAKRLYYPYRTPDEIALSANLSPEEKELLHQILTIHYVDQKKEDAVALLSYIAEGKGTNPPFIKELMHSTTLFQQLFQQDRSVFVDDSKISVGEMAKYVALHHPSFSELRMHALNRLLVTVLAKIFSIDVESEEIVAEKERFKVRHGLNMPLAFETWLNKNHLTEKEFDELMKERAVARKLYSSPLALGSSWRLHKGVLEELKLNNQYTHWAEKSTEHKAAWQKSTPFYFEMAHDEIFDNEIFLEHVENSEWDLDVPIKTWCEEAGFLNLQELALELHKAHINRKREK